MESNLYLVPHDFTAVGDNALRYAVSLSKQLHTEILLVHIVSDRSKAAAAEQKLLAIIDQQDKSGSLEFSYRVETGSIFEDIGKIATQEGAQLIVMGTHGATGFQKLFGSHAMKVITSNNVPFLIVQENTVFEKINTIVVPIDLSNESLQITNVAGDLAMMTGSDIHVVYEKISDMMLRRKMANSLSIVQKNYEDRGLTANFHELSGAGSPHKLVINYAKENNGGLIALAYHSDKLLPQFDTFAQTLITNKLNIPCVIINAKSASSAYF